MVRPLLEEAWAGLPESVARQLQEQLEKGEEAVDLFARRPPENPLKDQQKQWRWTSEPPLLVTISLVTGIVAVVVASVYILVDRFTQ